MRTISIAVLCTLLGVGPAVADNAPKIEITATTNPGVKPPQPRGCAETATGDEVPIPRSEGDGVDMDACKPAPAAKQITEQVPAEQVPAE